MTCDSYHTRLCHHFRYLRFSMRTLLVAVTLVAIWLGLYVQRARQQHAAVATILKYGGWVHYDYQLTGIKFNPQGVSWVPDWMQTQLGDDMFHNVTEINFSYNDGNSGRADNQNLDPAPLECLPAFPKLKYLLLHRSQASDENLQHVRGLTHLERIYIWDAANLTDAGAAHLTGLPHLKYLHISDSQITDKSLHVFAELPRLEGLSLQFNRFTSDGVRQLHKLEHLQSLWICGRMGRPNDISDEALEFLLSRPAMKEVGVQHTKVTLEFTDRLKARFPGIYISQTPVAQQAQAANSETNASEQEETE